MATDLESPVARVDSVRGATCHEIVTALGSVGDGGVEAKVTEDPKPCP
jgi:hypothetical protein